MHSSIDCTDSRIASRLWVNLGEVLNGRDDDDNGCIDDIHGCNFGHAGLQPGKIGDGLVCFGDNGEEAADPALPVNHDVAVAGLAVAPIDGAGRVGASPAADLVILVADLNPEEFRDRVIPYLESIGSRILLTPYSAGSLEETACQEYTDAWLDDAGQPMFAQPGSPIWLFGFPDEWPMCQPEALSVGALQSDDSTLATHAQSHVPANGVDIAIPGFFQSTALGTTAGVLALLLEQEPALPIEEITVRLADSADRVGPLPYDVSG